MNTITREDFRAVMDEWIAKKQEEIGSPEQITMDEIVAYMAGALPPLEFARVRQFVAYYPELTDVAIAIGWATVIPFPDDAADSDDPRASVPPESIERHLAALKRRIGEES